MKKCGIYRITNMENGKFYVGSSKDIKKRWYTHKYRLRHNKHHNIHLQRSWNKYGEDAFVFEIIVSCKIEELEPVESAQLDAYFGSDMCYNVSPHVSGGDILTTHPDRDRIVEKITAATRQLSKTLTKEEKQDRWARYGPDNPNYGNTWNEDQRKAASNRMKKRLRSKEERKKISEAQKKRFRDKRERKKISDFAKTRTGEKNPFYGKHHTEETKQKIREKNTGGYKGNQERKVSIDGVVYRSVCEAARQLNVVPGTICHRIRSKNLKFSEYFYVG